jgi:HAD superfamily phosphoserine phosphatase-like hydrolase
MPLPTAAPERPYLLVSDFDGTMTERDFFLCALDLCPEASAYWQGYQAGEMTHFQALQAIFAALPGDEVLLQQLADQSQIDPQLSVAVQRLRAAGWEVVVASAGCDWYIRQLLARQQVEIAIFANPGEVIPGRGLQMRLPAEGPFFSATLGVAKEKIVQQALLQFQAVAFAGDSRTDLAAARLLPAHRRFARADLAGALQSEQQQYVPFTRWSELPDLLLQ